MMFPTDQGHIKHFTEVTLIKISRLKQDLESHQIQLDAVRQFCKHPEKAFRGPGCSERMVCLSCYKEI